MEEIGNSLGHSRDLAFAWQRLLLTLSCPLVFHFCDSGYGGMNRYGNRAGYYGGRGYGMDRFNEARDMFSNYRMNGSNGYYNVRTSELICNIWGCAMKLFSVQYTVVISHELPPLYDLVSTELERIRT